MPRWVTALLALTLVASLGVNIVLAQKLQRAQRELRSARVEKIVCRDSKLLAYSPGAILAIDGQLKRCKLSGVWVDTDEWGKPLGGARLTGVRHAEVTVLGGDDSQG